MIRPGKERTKRRDDWWTKARGYLDLGYEGICERKERKEEGEEGDEEEE
jgi:hypothetical protein